MMVLEKKKRYKKTILLGFLHSKLEKNLTENTAIRTHPGVRIGLQAGSSCCENLESAITKKNK